MKFKLRAPFKPTGDQPQAIEKLVKGVRKGNDGQTLLGVTGSGKTATMAFVIEKLQRPTLIISHNKTLAAQLCQEFREFFPENAVEYFVSYYDYYQPEAYIPQSDTYIEKETSINEEIDKLRLSTTTSLLTRRDVIVVASVSCIYNIGSPHEYGQAIVHLRKGSRAPREKLMRRLIDIHYARNDIDFRRGTFRVRGETIDIYPSYLDEAIRVIFFGDTIESMAFFDPVSGETKEKVDEYVVYPGKHYIADATRFSHALVAIEHDLSVRVRQFEQAGRLVEAQRLKQRTAYDLEMMREFGYCNGIENYSRYFDGRKVGEQPHTLLEFFPEDYLVFIDESHITLPQIRGMYYGDRSRKETLIDFGFRLPAAIDNRPLRYEEFARMVNQTIYVSATPGDDERSISRQVVEQLIRPTGLLDPEVDVRATDGQIPHLMAEIKKRVDRGERVLVTTLTKRMAEDLAEYLQERKVKVTYIHADIETLKRSDILEDLRHGNVDVLVGINLLREGLDLPEVSLVAILDADKEGYLRSATALIQTMGRAARHINGRVIMYADTITPSMQRAIDETTRRRKRQIAYNQKHHVTPRSITKDIRERLIGKAEEEATIDVSAIPPDERERMIRDLRRQMRLAADALQFERAAHLRDQIQQLEE